MMECTIYADLTLCEYWFMCVCVIMSDILLSTETIIVL